MSWIDRLHFDERGLLPVIAQDADSGEVLMLAWATGDALARTAETGRAHYWSRSRNSLWAKGETSGNVQQVREIRIDCDGDTVLYRVRQRGPACHTGERSCFASRVEGDALVPAPDPRHILSRVDGIVETRERERPAGSYTTYLFEQGVDKILKKVGEESTETVIAAKNPGTDELRSEAADLFFHLLVLFRARGLALREVWDELERRFGAPPRER